MSFSLWHLQPLTTLAVLPSTPCGGLRGQPWTSRQELAKYKAQEWQWRPYVHFCTTSLHRDTWTLWASVTTKALLSPDPDVTISLCSSNPLWLPVACIQYCMIVQQEPSWPLNGEFFVVKASLSLSPKYLPVATFSYCDSQQHSQTFS